MTVIDTSLVTAKRLDRADCQKALDDMRPLIGNCRWLWSILRTRFRQTGWFPRQIHLRLLRFTNPRKPYFIGTLADGTQFVGNVHDAYSCSLAVNPNAEEPLLKFLDASMPTDGNAIDVGANMGRIAVFMARRLQGRGHIYAFEPTPDTARRAAATFALNGLENVSLFPCAVGDMNGEIKFYHAENHTDLASATPSDFQTSWKETDTPCRTLDDIIVSEEIHNITFMKIDVEGHELKVFQGARALMQRDKPGILFEFNMELAPKTGWTPEDVFDLLPYYKFQIVQENGRMIEYSPSNGTAGHIDLFGQAIPLMR